MTEWIAVNSAYLGEEWEMPDLDIYNIRGHKHRGEGFDLVLSSTVGEKALPTMERLACEAGLLDAVYVVTACDTAGQATLMCRTDSPHTGEVWRMQEVEDADFISRTETCEEFARRVYDDIGRWPDMGGNWHEYSIPEDEDAECG